MSENSSSARAPSLSNLVGGIIGAKKARVKLSFFYSRFFTKKNGST